ncbi:MAG: TetR/AcrR family transcriptional regulator [Eggerthellaceae bacterium]
MPYDQIKVTALAREARVSPNTLYYHFANMEAVARAALDRCLDANVVRAVLSGEDAALPGFDATRQERVAAFARSGSAALTGMLVESLRAEWLAVADVAAEDLTEAERRDLAFIFGGVVYALGDGSLGIGAEGMRAFLARPLGQGVAATMTALRA